MSATNEEKFVYVRACFWSSSKRPYLTNAWNAVLRIRCKKACPHSCSESVLAARGSFVPAHQHFYKMPTHNNQKRVFLPESYQRSDLARERKQPVGSEPPLLTEQEPPATSWDRRYRSDVVLLPAAPGKEERRWFRSEIARE